MSDSGRTIMSVPADDRGLRYGDGVFETMLWRAHRCVLWPWHRVRLLHGLERLAIPQPELGTLEARLIDAQGECEAALLRLTVTRGSGPHGYAPPECSRARVIIDVTAVPVAEQTPAANSLTVRWCALRLARQPALAGIKHLNRLEQVLARAEWRDAGIHEGLLCDEHEHVIGATSANLFASIDGHWVTPLLDECGVAGVCRAALLDAPDAGRIEVRALKRAEVERADEVVLTNAVRGVRAVANLAGRQLAPGALYRWATERSQALGFVPVGA